MQPSETIEIYTHTLKLAFVKLILHLFKRQTSNYYIVYGRRGSGKTDFALLIAEITKSVFKAVATNVKIYKTPFEIERITNLDDLKAWSRRFPGRKLYLLDEIGKSISRRRPMSKINIDMINELQVIRKHKLSLIATTIDETCTDSSVIQPSHVDGVFTKPNFKNPKIAYFNDYLGNKSLPLTNLPRTSIHFDTWDSAPFTIHGEIKKPAFKSEQLSKLWDWSQGATYKEIGWHPQQLNRVVRKFVKEAMERDYSQFTV